jgi:hypothetical protein
MRPDVRNSRRRILLLSQEYVSAARKYCWFLGIRIVTTLGIALLATSLAGADPVSFDVGGVLDTVAVRHAIDDQPESFVAPLPFFFADGSYGRLSVDAQALSTFGSLSFGNQATSLGIAVYSLRYHVRKAYAGVGITSLNQRTDFDPQAVGPTATDTLTERSHLYGVRYEAGVNFGRAQLDIAVTPSIHGTVFDHCNETVPGAVQPCLGEGYNTIDASVPEVAAEFDSAFRYYIPISSQFDGILGLRYINFIGRVTYPSHIDTDQNRGAPLLSVGLRYRTR